MYKATETFFFFSFISIIVSLYLSGNRVNFLEKKIINCSEQTQEFNKLIFFFSQFSFFRMEEVYSFELLKFFILKEDLFFLVK